MQERFLREPGAVHPDRKRRRWVPRWLVFGLLRLCLWVLLISAVAIGLGLLVGHIRGTDPSRSIPLSLYIAGTAVMLVTFGGALSGRNLYRVAWDESTANDEIARRVQAGRGVYAIVGALVIGLGILFDWLL
jgi:hypothetical protein